MMIASYCRPRLISRSTNLRAVVDNPADGAILQPGELGVFPGPGYHALSRVHMADDWLRLPRRPW